ncbi:hypothetical protein [Lentibacillus sediminis]|uniref:hypothetical protein n=1 Tax=Lentibacillus sediminis TaxID=1940529 RepID=UPI00117BD002|nr:hypothetical protein [Lentibacillus sediminis]
MNNNNNVNGDAAARTPWKPMAGFMLCIMLAGVSLWAAFYSGYSPKLIFSLIALFSFILAVYQLFDMQLEPEDS